MVLQLVSGDPLYVRRKAFRWQLAELSSARLAIQLAFAEPELVSQGPQPDVLRISFFNTTQFLEPVTAHKEAIPDGYTIEVTLPIQREESELAEQAEAGFQFFVFSNFFLAFIVNYSLQSIASMIGNL